MFCGSLANESENSMASERSDLHNVEFDDFGQGIYLGKDYSKGEAPYKTNISVFVAINRFVVREIDDNAKTLAFDFLFSMIWSDPRINANFSEFETEKDIRNNMASLKIWKPDIGIRRLTDRKSLVDSIDVKRFRLQKNINYPKNPVIVEWMFGGRVEIYCYYSLAMYPLDTQNCISSLYGRGSSAINFNISSFGHPKYHDLNENYIAAGFDVSTTMINPTLNNQFGISLKLRRLIQPFLFKYYLPTIIIVIISGLGFLFPLTILPGRITLGVTQFLTLTNLFIHQMVSLIYSFRIKVAFIIHFSAILKQSFG